MIRFEDLPEWAKENIRKTGPTQTIQMIRNCDSLSVSGGKAFFNGHAVAMNGEQVEDETIYFSELPDWAQKEIEKSSKASGMNFTQRCVNGKCLQINPVHAVFDDKLVVGI